MSVDKVDFVPEGEDTAIAMFRFGNSALGELTVSYSAKMEGWEWFWPSGWDQLVQLYGAEGALSIELPHNLLHLYSEKETIPKETRGRSAIPVEKDYASTFDSEVQHFIESLQNDTPFERV
jgi:predicted dehydrogenase